jgi:hypothetical protein
LNMDIVKTVQLMQYFDIQGEVTECIPWGKGHINDTFRVTCDVSGAEKHYLLQSINGSVFEHPEEVMENIVRVTDFIRNKLIAEGEDSQRGTLHVIPALDGRFYHIDDEGTYWRVYDFLEGMISLEQVRNAHDFYTCGEAFGHFQYLLSDFDAALLHETIPGFRDTAARFQQLMTAVEEDRFERAAGVADEIEFYYQRKEDTHVLADALHEGRIPLRVTHNDTKLNNILFDKVSGEAMCVIDLDTVMPGMAATDFGDAIRFGANTAVEDEPDCSKAGLNIDLYHIYKEGFVKGCNGGLTDEEIDMLPWGARTITLEQGMRFLTDYIKGDVYYKIERPEQNLDRSRTQRVLLQDIEKHFNELL